MAALLPRLILKLARANLRLAAYFTRKHDMTFADTLTEMAGELDAIAAYLSKPAGHAELDAANAEIARLHAANDKQVADDAAALSALQVKFDAINKLIAPTLQPIGAVAG